MMVLPWMGRDLERTTFPVCEARTGVPTLLAISRPLCCQVIRPWYLRLVPNADENRPLAGWMKGPEKYL